MVASSIPAAIDGLLGLLTTAAAAGSVPNTTTPVQAIKVFDGISRENVAQRDFIAVGGWPEPTVSGEQQPGPVGNRKRNETFTIRVYCQSSRGVGATQKQVRDNAFALFALVETVVRDNPTLSGAVQLAMVAEGSIDLIQTDIDTAEQGAVALVTSDVTITNSRI